VHRRIGGIVELPRDESVLGLGGYLVRGLDRATHTVGFGGQDELRAVRRKKLAALDGHGLRHGEDDPVAARRAYHRQSYTCIARCRLNEHRVPALDEAARFSVVDHPKCDSVLDRTTRVA
jgi:hypothetical protein